MYNIYLYINTVTDNECPNFLVMNHPFYRTIHKGYIAESNNDNIIMSNDYFKLLRNEKTRSLQGTYPT